MLPFVRSWLAACSNVFSEDLLENKISDSRHSTMTRVHFGNEGAFCSNVVDVCWPTHLFLTSTRQSNSIASIRIQTKHGTGEPLSNFLGTSGEQEVRSHATHGLRSALIIT